MNSTIDMRIEFSFKGENYSPKATIQLDKLVQVPGDGLPDFYLALAKQNNIDTYSYLYDAMETYEIVFENATGLATQCLKEGQLDFEKFQQLWHQQQELDLMQGIAKQHLDVDDLEQQQNLKNALFEAYQLGKSVKSK